MEQNIDIKENYIYQLDANLLAILLLDKSSGKNIIWATDNYAERGFGYQSSDQIMVDSITHRNGALSNHEQPNQKSNRQFAFVTRRRFSLRRGYVTTKITLWTTHGSAEKMCLTQKTVRHGSHRQKKLLFPKAGHGRTM